MAEEEKTLEEEVTGEDDASKKKKGPLLLIIIGAAVFLLIVITGLVYYFVFADDGKEELKPEFFEFEQEFQLKQQEELLTLNKPYFVKSQVYTINLRTRRKYLRIALVFALADQNAAIYLKSQLPQVDDMVITHIQSLKLEDLLNEAGLEILKINILRMVNSVFTEEFIALSDTKDRLPVKKVLVERYFLN